MNVVGMLGYVIIGIVFWLHYANVTTPRRNKDQVDDELSRFASEFAFHEEPSSYISFFQIGTVAFKLSMIELHASMKN